jgi:hypothetical protein
MYQKKKSVPEEVAHAVNSNQIINLEDWSINFNEFQPDGFKQLKKHASEESQGNQDKRNDSSYNLGCDQYVPPYPNPEDTHTKFWNTKPPMFSNTMDHLEADEWITTIEQKLDLVQCNGRKKVSFASGQLVGAASEWWNSYIYEHE